MFISCIIYKVTLVHSTIQCKDVGPYQEIFLDSDIVEIRPNTGDKPNIIAVLLITGSVKIISFESNNAKVISEIKGDVSSSMLSNYCKPLHIT